MNARNLTDRILLPEMDMELVSREIGDFIVANVTKARSTGGVIGLSGGVDSTSTAALAKKAFDHYEGPVALELVGYILPSNTNNPKDLEDGVKVAERLGIRYEIVNIEHVVEAFRLTNPEAFENNYDKGNLMSRIRANILLTKAATGKKFVIGTGNKDEDFGIGYYTLFGDGAVHISPIGNLSKRLVRQMAAYLGFPDLANREPTAGLEPNQTDFGDLGYNYSVVELVREGLRQGFTPIQLTKHDQVVPLVKTQMERYNSIYGKNKFDAVDQVVEDVLGRHYNVALPKAELISPPIAPVTLIYK